MQIKASELINQIKKTFALADKKVSAAQLEAVEVLEGAIPHLRSFTAGFEDFFRIEGEASEEAMAEYVEAKNLIALYEVARFRAVTGA